MRPSTKLLCPVLPHSKKRQRNCTMAVPMTAARKAAERKAAPVVSVEVATPTYLEVPEFQRVAIIGDYASGVLLSTLLMQ